MSYVWPVDQNADTRTKAQWISFCDRPFTGVNAHSSYVMELAKISSTYIDDMNRVNSKGVSVLIILKNGSSREHFEALQNGSRLKTYLGKSGDRLGVGTTRNEQLHRELKSWSRNIYKSHKGRLQCGFRIF